MSTKVKDKESAYDFIYDIMEIFEEMCGDGTLTYPERLENVEDMCRTVKKELNEIKKQSIQK